jgi:hypothetical protein
MRSVKTIFLGLALLGAATCPVWAAKPPVVVELFTAQGCASCTAADEAAAALADRVDVLPLTFSVDYWDYLGWTDSFARGEFSDRQRVYARRFGIRDVYTPQVVIDGMVETSGAKPAAIEPLIAAQARLYRNPPDMETMGSNRVAVGTGRAPAGGAEVYLVRYEPRPTPVSVRSGENRGRTLEYRNVVRELVLLGPWAGRPRAYRLPPQTEDGLTSAILVQGANGGPMIGVMIIPTND